MKAIARQQLYVNFGFIDFYPLFFSLACAMLSESPFDKMTAVGVFISWALLVAGLLDIVENLALLRMLNTGASQFFAWLATMCAGSKFLIVYSGLGYLLLQGLSVLASKIRA
jgi:hypothetical protein